MVSLLKSNGFVQFAAAILSANDDVFHTVTFADNSENLLL